MRATFDSLIWNICDFRGLVIAAGNAPSRYLLKIGPETLIGPRSSLRARVSPFWKRSRMSQTIQPPILPEGSPDRAVNCEVALEAAFAALVAESEAQGWTAQETAETLLKIATEHIHLLGAAVEPKA